MGWRPLSDSHELVLWSPREFNTVADHACNATMDSGQSVWFRGDRDTLKNVLRAGSNLRMCVDGGRRSQTKGAIGFAIYCLRGDCSNDCSYQLLLRGGKLLEQVASSFVAEALALEWALECLIKLCGSVTT